MPEDVNEQLEAEEMDLEAEGAAPRRKRCGFWAVTTLIFVVATAVLAWLYTIQIDELAALRADADRAGSQVVRLQQANRRVSSELADLMSKLSAVVKVVNELQEVEGVQPAAEKAAAEGKELAAEAAAEAPESQPAEEAKAAEEAKPAEQQQPRAPQPRVPAVPPKP